MVLVNNMACPSEDRRAGFTMIELLVVIAIIALLAAIIFPVFSTVQENARQSNSMSNLHDISTKMDQYKLDTQQYPPVLFGYHPSDPAGATVGMDKVLGYCQSLPSSDADSCANILPGLYPEYVKSWSEFTDPNNNAKLSATVGPLTSTDLCSTGDAATGCTTAGQLVILNGTTTPKGPTFYQADSYDWSPQVTSANTIAVTNGTPTVELTRYETSWTSIAKNLDCSSATPPPADAQSVNLCYGPVDPQNPAADSNNVTPVSPFSAENQYTDQLRWQNPPSTTYITCTTYHVPQAGVVLMLTQDGTVQKVPANKFVNFDQQTTDALTVNDTTNNAEVDDVQFWRISL